MLFGRKGSVGDGEALRKFGCWAAELEWFFGGGFEHFFGVRLHESGSEAYEIRFREICVQRSEENNLPLFPRRPANRCISEKDAEYSGFGWFVESFEEVFGHSLGESERLSGVACSPES